MSEIAKHWIDGEWTGSDTVSESVNPATGAVLGRWADGGEAEARAAVAAARRAFDTSPWSRDRSLRHRVLNEMADRFDAHAEELGTLVTKENGKKTASAACAAPWPSRSSRKPRPSSTPFRRSRANPAPTREGEQCSGACRYRAGAP
jgi:hypothetical protein